MQSKQIIEWKDIVWKKLFNELFMAVHRKKLRGFKRFKSFLSIAM